LQFDDLFSVNLPQTAAKDGEILGIDLNDPAVDSAPAGHHAVAQVFALLQPKANRAMGHKHVYLAPGTGVKQSVNPFPGRQLALGVLLPDPFLATPELGHSPLLS
jgi:hypothetical protein